MVSNHDNIVIMSSQNKKRVFVGLSGGVDSAVSAGLLIKAGYDVTGVFIKVWQPDWIECNWKEERRDAMRVSAHLGIPFITLDLVNEYKQDVIDYMIREYENGRTPNPDVMCNRYVKFGGFLKWAKEQGADFVATGHYARVEKVLKNGVEAGFDLLAGIDKNKDQSYFLWTLNQKDLPNILFPVGHLTKPEVRKLAKEFDLPNSTKKDSQGLCFIGKVDVKDFLSHYIKTEKGEVLNESGEVIGTHPGALFFTKGERRGFVLTNKTPNDLPYFVINKDIKKNTITVSNKEVDGKLPGSEKQVKISNVNWVSGEAPSIDLPNVNFPIFARSRYRQELSKVRIASVNASETVLEFETPQDSLTPGQSLVIYDGEKCLGGGVIEFKI
jgi:tRNA-specific 2-thiouridylase